MRTVGKCWAQLVRILLHRPAGFPETENPGKPGKFKWNVKCLQEVVEFHISDSQSY